MVRRCHKDQRSRIIRGDVQRGRQNGRGGVAAKGFDQDRAGVDAGCGKLFNHDEAKIAVGHDDGAVKPRA